MISLVKYRRIQCSKLVYTLNSRHSREACPRLERGTEIQSNNVPPESMPRTQIRGRSFSTGTGNCSCVSSISTTPLKGVPRSLVVIPDHDCMDAGVRAMQDAKAEARYDKQFAYVHQFGTRIKSLWHRVHNGGGAPLAWWHVRLSNSNADPMAVFPGGGS